jgi:hypothetical protein
LASSRSVPIDRQNAEAIHASARGTTNSLEGKSTLASRASGFEGANLKGGLTMVEGTPPCKRPRRNKTFWEAHRQNLQELMPTGWEARPPADARGKKAIRGSIDKCTSCNLASSAAGGCSHGEASRVYAPVMLLSTQATQVTKPKLARLSNAPSFHNLLLTSLERPVPSDQAKRLPL